MAKEIILNAKLRRTSICGATETLLVDRDFGQEKTREIINALIEAGCEVRVDGFVKTFMPALPSASQEDWGTEYLDAVIAVKSVKDVKEAAAHIRKYGSGHTEAIITEDARAAEDFLNIVGSAVVMHNTSTQFCDGGEFGMGAEIGIATGKLHARGPVGLEQLVTFKYKVRGHGEVRK
jgi:glutamate-5-semialdehyde dehydrogenase